jgi:hypothetical protein
MIGFSRRSLGRRALLLIACVGGLASPALADRIKHPTAVFSGLDKITGRVISFEVATDETVQFGTLQITERACFTRPPTEAPQTDTFVEVDDIDPTTNEAKRIFSGWMFAASPGLNGIEHPVYDIWLTDCKGGTEVIPSPPETATVDPADIPPPDNASKTPVKPAQKPRKVQPTVNAFGEPLQGAPPNGRGGDVAPPPTRPQRSLSDFFGGGGGASPARPRDPAGNGGF